MAFTSPIKALHTRLPHTRWDLRPCVAVFSALWALILVREVAWCLFRMFSQGLHAWADVCHFATVSP